MKVIYLGKNKPAAVSGLQFLVDRGVHVLRVVAPPVSSSRPIAPSLAAEALRLGIPAISEPEMYNCAENAQSGRDPQSELADVDLVISFLFWKRIKRPLIDLPRVGCINFHPAPLPDYRGLGGYNFAIYDHLDTWGVSAHYVDENFDTGDIVRVRRFDINAGEHTAWSLEQLSQRHLLELFKEVIDVALATKSLPRSPQGPGRYICREDVERLRRIGRNDTLEQIERKIRAFWYPPYPGALVEVQGKAFSLVDESILKELGSAYAGQAAQAAGLRDRL